MLRIVEDYEELARRAELECKYPITGIAGCCARAASGHPAVALISATNSRRPMPDMAAPSLHGLPHAQPATEQAGRSMGQA
jgi:hypothetical protein